MNPPEESIASSAVDPKTAEQIAAEACEELDRAEETKRNGKTISRIVHNILRKLQRDLNDAETEEAGSAEAAMDLDRFGDIHRRITELLTAPKKEGGTRVRFKNRRPPKEGEEGHTFIGR